MKYLTFALTLALPVRFVFCSPRMEPASVSPDEEADATPMSPKFIPYPAHTKLAYLRVMRSYMMSLGALPREINSTLPVCSARTGILKASAEPTPVTAERKLL